MKNFEQPSWDEWRDFCDQLFAAWSETEALGTEAIRELIKVDRYYLLVKVLRRKDLLHPWVYARCREVESAPDGYIDIWAREHGKDLANDTPVLTSLGWIDHGKLRPGDQVFSPSGELVRVLAVSPVYQSSECFQIRFQDGASLVAGAGHLWRVRHKVRKRIVGTELRDISWRYETLNTQQLRHIRGRRDVGVCDPIQLPVQQLPLDPYVLGCWLGDGNSGSAAITCAYTDIQIIEEIRAKGVSAEERRSSNKNTGLYRLDCGVRGKKGTGLTSLLRKMGLINNKHIPEQYLQASTYQRMELLRGLMDTDGSCNDRGTATFCVCTPRLAEQTYELAASLGLRPRLRAYDRHCKFWQVSFQAHTDRNPFRLHRKMARAIPPSRHRRTRNIVSINRVPTVHTRCIQVEGDLYLAGRALIPTHNSSLITNGGVIQEVLRDPEITVGIFSHTKPIAKAFLAQIKREFEGNEVLRALYPDILWEDPQRQSPSWSLDGGIIVRREGNPKEGTIEAHGLVDGQPTSKHFKLLVYDDVVVPESVSTPDQIAKTTEAWSLSDNLGSIGGRKWVLGTRYHFKDTYADIIERGAAIPRIYPATDDGTPDGRPVLFPQKVWDQKKRDQLESTIACQMLANPLAGKQRMFNVEDLQTYEVRPLTLMAYLLIDPARSVKKDSANTAMVVIGVDSAGNKYLLDGVDHKMDLMERWRWMRDLWECWNRSPGIVGVHVGYERFGAIADLDYFHERQRIENTRFEIVELEWPREGEGSKKDRVQRLVPDIRGHRFYLPYPTDDDRLTSLQLRMVSQGYEYRLAQRIRRADENDRIYDVSDRFRMQVSYFPFGGLKDLLDAASRLYDIDPVTPTVVDESYLEPEIV